MGVDLIVQEGSVLGIIGGNGAGKSTLLKILSRVTAPSIGQVKVRGRIASLLEVGTGFHPELTGRENIFLNGAVLGMSKIEIKRKLDEIIEFAGNCRQRYYAWFCQRTPDCRRLHHIGHSISGSTGRTTTWDKFKMTLSRKIQFRGLSQI